AAQLRPTLRAALLVDPAVACLAAVQQHGAAHAQGRRHVHGDDAGNAELRDLRQMVEARAPGPGMEVEDVRAILEDQLLELAEPRALARRRVFSDARPVAWVADHRDALPVVLPVDL